jgi:hypothetical protein
MRRLLVRVSAILVLVPASAAFAQEDTTVTTAGADQGPGGATTAVVQDDQAAEMERMQRDAEEHGEPSTDDAVIEDHAAEPEIPEDSLHHGNQMGVRVGIGFPFVFAVRYGGGAACNDKVGDDGEPEAFCRHFGAPLLDLVLEYGVTPGVEIGFLGRIGLTEDVAANNEPFQLGFGARVYPSPHPLFKVSLGVRAMMDYTPSDTAQWKELDFGVRGEVGLQVDFNRYVGLYFGISVQLMFMRSLYFVTDANGGLQFRFP